MRISDWSSDVCSSDLGETYHFCSAGCRTKFLADPQRYIGASVTSVRVAEGTIWSCPMHPEIWQDHPGACPICCLTLSPASVSATRGPSNEMVDVTPSFWKFGRSECGERVGQYL